MILPRISIVTPSYNQGLFLEACIKSILDQNYPNLEYIVLDGGSTDLSKYILKKYSGSFSYWRSSPDKGQYQAIQEGFDRATGDILAWLNSDDMLHPGSLWIIAETYKANPDSLWFTGIPTKWNRSGELTYINPSVPDWSHKYFTNLGNSECKVFLQQESTFFTRKLWVDSGSKINTRYELAADFELWLRFSRHSKVHKVDALIGGFREHGNQKTSNQYQKYLNEVSAILEVEANLPTSATEATAEHSFQVNNNELLIGTSLAPKDLVNQSKAISSWINNGYIVHSFNSKEEILKLANLYPNVVFHEVAETAESITGKPLVFLKDIFSYFHSNNLPFTLVNADIHFSVNSGLAQRLAVEHDRHIPSMLLASRIEIENEFTQFSEFNQHNAITRLKYGRHYFMGFDLFSFNLTALGVINKLLHQEGVNKYGLGIPWWDYWLPMIALENDILLKYLVPSPVFHVYHEAQYSKKLWRDYGCNFCLEFKLIDELQLSEINKEADRVDDYLNNTCAQIIRTLGSNFHELDLGACLRAPVDQFSSGILNDCVSQERFHLLWFNRLEMIDDALSKKAVEVENMERIMLELLARG